jgi:hypothetical protein
MSTGNENLITKAGTNQVNRRADVVYLRVCPKPEMHQKRHQPRIQQIKRYLRTDILFA